MRWAVLVMLAGCGAQVADGDPAVDAGTRGPDAVVLDAMELAIDAPPPPPCVEGDTRMATTSGCFAAFTTTPKTRVDARATCAAAGMHLAYVRSAADEAVIAILANGMDVAIGLDDLVTEGTFRWEDNSPLTYTDWHTGEPNDGGGVYAEDCVVYAGARVGGQWDDRPCAPPPELSGVYGFICQR